ncbi:hypothetical protein O3M35_006898 [Rhynocoris fuscipes]|uniref:Nuclear transcription factor Y subunit n=1 Tax=Rhynocoris fuscipes TaxID=488301 RepID=A0AAW1DHU8_9HEMI
MYTCSLTSVMDNDILTNSCDLSSNQNIITGTAIKSIENSSGTFVISETVASNSPAAPITLINLVQSLPVRLITLPYSTLNNDCYTLLLVEKVEGEQPIADKNTKPIIENNNNNNNDQPQISQDFDSEPIYVNAKQYKRILKRREARKRLFELGRIPKKRKGYLHESRHIHALKRLRTQDDLLSLQWRGYCVTVRRNSFLFGKAIFSFVALVLKKI